MTNQTAADKLFETFRAVYAERMTAAALIGGGEPLRQMTEARDTLQRLTGCSKLDAANMVRVFHVRFCDDIGHEVPAEYRSGLIEAIGRAV